MIRINLLPVREIKKKEAVKRAIVIYVVSIAAAVCVMVFLFLTVNAQVKSSEQKKEALVTEEEALRKKVAAVAQLIKEEAELQEKLGVINDLESKRRGPVKMLDELSRRLPPEKAFLTDLTQSGDLLTINGYAMDMETVVQFMANLDPSADDPGRTPIMSDMTGGAKPEVKPEVKPAAAPAEGGAPAEGAGPKFNIFKSVELISTQQEMKGELPLKKFTLTCKVMMSEPQVTDADAKDAKNNTGK